MHVRCGKCHGALWVDPADLADVAACRACGDEFALDPGRKLEAARGQLSGPAREFAREQEIDLPGAYSVLFGIMTLEEVRELGQPGPITGPAPDLPEPSSEHRRGAISFDPAFKPAVGAGLLSALQAASRGKRSEFAESLARRHRLPMPVALDIADNRISLLQALRAHPSAPAEPAVTPPPHAEPRRTPGPWLRLPRAARVALLTALVCGVPAAVLSLNAPASPSRRQVKGTDVQMDADGRVLSVTAADPEQVLTGYCQANARRGFVPLRTVQTPRTGPGVRLGVFRWTGREGRVFAIEIREDTAAGRWVASGGSGPLEPRPAPRDAEEALSVVARTAAGRPRRRRTQPGAPDPARVLRAARRAVATARGFTALELLVVIGIIGLVAAGSMAALNEFVVRERTMSALRMVQNKVEYARIQAMKQKVRHRIVVHDESAAQPNRIEVQREVGGAFATQARGTVTLAPGVKVLGSGTTNSIDSVVVTTRGWCDPGFVYFRGRDGRTEVLRISSTCLTDAL